MKKRKGYSPIVVDNKQFQYSVSFGKAGIDVYIFDVNDYKYVIRVAPEDMNFTPPDWRGKWKDQSISKKVVSELIKKYILK